MRAEDSARPATRPVRGAGHGPAAWAAPHGLHPPPTHTRTFTPGRATFAPKFVCWGPGPQSCQATLFGDGVFVKSGATRHSGRGPQRRCPRGRGVWTRTLTRSHRVHTRGGGRRGGMRKSGARQPGRRRRGRSSRPTPGKEASRELGVPPASRPPGRPPAPRRPRHCRPGCRRRPAEAEGRDSRTGDSSTSQTESARAGGPGAGFIQRHAVKAAPAPAAEPGVSRAGGGCRGLPGSRWMASGRSPTPGRRLRLRPGARCPSVVPGAPARPRGFLGACNAGAACGAARAAHRAPPRPLASGSGGCHAAGRVPQLRGRAPVCARACVVYTCSRVSRARARRLGAGAARPTPFALSSLWLPRGGDARPLPSGRLFSRRRRTWGSRCRTRNRTAGLRPRVPRWGPALLSPWHLGSQTLA